jgi:hypothetical protein
MDNKRKLKQTQQDALLEEKLSYNSALWVYNFSS